MIWLIVKMCEVVELFLWKLFWFSPKIFMLDTIKKQNIVNSSNDSKT